MFTRKMKTLMARGLVSRTGCNLIARSCVCVNLFAKLHNTVIFFNFSENFATPRYD